MERDRPDYTSGMVVQPVRAGVGFTSGGVSRWMRRRQGWLAAVVVVACIAGLAVFVAGFVVPGSAWVMRAVFFGGVLIPVLIGAASFAVLARARGRERAAAASASGYACPNCLYDLSAEPVERCSECGQRVIYEGLPVLWENASWRWMARGRVDGNTGFSATGLSVFEVRAQRWALSLSLRLVIGTGLSRLRVLSCRRRLEQGSYQ